MRDRIRDAFDQIQAEEPLKAHTKDFLARKDGRLYPRQAAPPDQGCSCAGLLRTDSARRALAVFHPNSSDQH